MRLSSPGWKKKDCGRLPRRTGRTLLRRLSLDLVGLPPTIAELDAFHGDQSADWYEWQVDRLLHSPHYGERWARHWLDAARYADCDGYEKDKPRSVWFYRDWVIGAFNRDLPYDQFIIEQIAGDLLPNRTQDQIVATGFLRNSMINEEGGIDPEQFRMEAMFDRMDAIGKGILGLTIQCAQCHNHKYDPLTQEDYYRMFAFLNDAHEANIAVYTPAEQQKRADLFRRIRAIEDDLKHKNADWRRQMAEWEQRSQERSARVDRRQGRRTPADKQRYVYHEDGSLTAWGYAPTKWTAQFSGKTERQAHHRVPAGIADRSQPAAGGPGRSPLGLFALSEFQVDVADAEARRKEEGEAGFGHGGLCQRATAAGGDVRRPQEQRNASPGR